MIKPLLAAVLAVSGCTSTEREPPTEGALEAAAEAEAPGAAMIEKEGSQAIDDVIEKTQGDAADSEDKGGEHVGDEISHATTESIPLEINAEVEKWIEYFTVRDGERFRRFMERGERYKPMITAVLRDQGIPTEIYYQAMIESGFSTHATSHASAVGIWQFIKGTGRRYGLRVDNYVDERRDPMRATIAASLYMKDLYNVFQSWYLAMAAYNAGEGRILGAIMRAKTRDFWEMVRMRALPAETMAYIPKFLAATTIGHNPRRYGFEDVTATMMAPLASVAVPSPVKLSDVSRASGVSLEVLKEANPHLLRGITPPGVDTYRLWVPKDQVVAVEGKLEAIAAHRINNLRATPVAAVATTSGAKPKHHVVERGETLVSVAGTYGVTVAQLKKLNGLKTNKVRPGKRLVLWQPEAQAVTFKRYKVKRGDNLNEIARKFNVSVEDLKKLNGLKRTTLYVGQVLKVASQQKG